MSMTREKAIALFEKQLTAAQVVLDSGFGSNPGENNFLYRRRKEMAEIALSALRPVSRERVERIWFREPYTRLETKCGENGDIVYSAVNTCMACGHETPIGNFCHNCGAAQTREAVEMVVERLESLYVERNDG